MKYALTADMAKYVDDYTINKIGIPSIVLMERAAEAVAVKTASVASLFTRPARILAVVNGGNNGADGIAAARILYYQGLDVDICYIGNGKKTAEYNIQEQIAKSSGINFVDSKAIPEYDIIMDGIFGVGLKRNVEGSFAEIIELINNSRNVVIAIDVPSGVSATTGAVMGVAVKADATVTFGYNKTGIMLNPGKILAGEVTVADIGFCPEAIKTLNPVMYFLPEDIKRIPERIKDSNKGTYGRTVVVAGSRDMSGAAYLSGAAAFRTGAGLVEIVTYKDNTDIIKKLLPEAIVKGYDDENFEGVLEASLKSATCIILGPGLSKSDLSKQVTEFVINNGKAPLIVDADALNILGTGISVLKSYDNIAIITPHIGEMTRISGLNKEMILQDSLKVAADFADRNNIVLVMKNAATVVAEGFGGHREYVNTSGSPAMSKAGMGDVLTGIIAGMLSLRLEPFSAAAMGVYIHGIAGELAAKELGEHSVMATDVINKINKAF